MHYVLMLVATLCFSYVIYEAQRPISKRVQRYRSRVRFMRVYNTRLRYIQLKTAQVGDLVQALTDKRTLLTEWTGEQRVVSLRKLSWDDFMNDVVRT